MVNRIIVLGAGGHSRVVVNLLERGGFQVSGYTAPSRSGRDIQISYLGTDEDLFLSDDNVCKQAAIGIGKTTSSDVRTKIMSMLMRRGIRFPVIRSDVASVHDDVGLGDGVVIMDGAIVVTGTSIGMACIINTNAVVDHDCTIDDDVHIAPGAVLCGGVHVGAHSLIGAGAVVTPSVRIGARCIIAAGSTVTSDLLEAGTYIGSPAKRRG